MGEKSRSNWNVPLCTKTDCMNRFQRCSECVRFHMYAKKLIKEKKNGTRTNGSDPGAQVGKGK